MAAGVWSSLCQVVQGTQLSGNQFPGSPDCGSSLARRCTVVEVGRGRFRIAEVGVRNQQDQYHQSGSIRVREGGVCLN